MNRAVFLLILVFLNAVFIINSADIDCRYPYKSCLPDYERLYLMILELALLIYLLTYLPFLKIKGYFKNFFLTMISFGVALFIIEGMFMFHAVSHGNMQTFASKLWYAKNWEVNKDDFRERPFGSKDAQGKTVITIIGDSYVAGVGIEDTADRFSNRLGKRLSSNYEVVNAGRSGANTQQEFQILQSLEYKPDVVILSHIPNDIMYLRKEIPISKREINKKLKVALAQGKKSESLIAFFEKSYLLNYAFWKFMEIKISKAKRRIMRKEDYKFCCDNAYLKWYTLPSYLNQHLSKISNFIRYCFDRNIKIVMLLFPETSGGQIDVSNEISSIPIESLCDSLAVPVFNTFDLLKSFPQEERIVNPHDAHPSVAANAKIADELYNFLLVKGIVSE